LDPIAALDRTGEVLIGAILAAVLEKAPPEIIAPLARSFIALQNLDASRSAHVPAMSARYNFEHAAIWSPRFRTQPPCAAADALKVPCPKQPGDLIRTSSSRAAQALLLRKILAC
jgi:hypothetical protein